MTDPLSTKPSIRDRVQERTIGSPVIATTFLYERPVVIGADGAALWLDGAQELQILHIGTSLGVICRGDKLLSGGDDGKVQLLEGPNKITTIADFKGKWIDQVALGSGETLAWSCGKTVFMQDGKKPAKTLDLPSTAGGLAFFPKGLRLAIGHYGGASLWFPNLIDTKPTFLEWKGSHLTTTVSPDGQFVVTSMQEPQLHGWRLNDSKNMRMSGYPSKVRSMAWTNGGKFLATSGAEAAILWPFSSKDGPMGTQPTMLGVSLKPTARVSAVAAHPKSDVVAVGYDDGFMLLVRIADAAEILVRSPDDDPIVSIAFRADGKQMIYGTENGKAGIAAL